MTAYSTGFSAADIVGIFRRQYKILRGGLLVTALVTGAWYALVPRTYEASGSFAAQYHSAGSGGNLGGLASQLGVEISADPSQSPAFYAELLTTRTVRLQLLRSLVKDPSKRDSIALLDYIVPESAVSADERLERGVEALSRLVTTGISVRTGIVYVRAVSTMPWLSAALVNALMRMVDDYNQRVRRSGAKSEREFVAQRVDELRGELNTAQARLAHFEEENRDLRSSPGKVIERDKLQTDVRLKLEAYGQQSRAYEQARVEEVRNTPAVTIIERAGIPIRSKPRRAWLPLFFCLAILTLVIITWDRFRMAPRAKNGGELSARP